MTMTVTVKSVVNNHDTRWLVLATVDASFPTFVRHHFEIGTATEEDALGIAGALIALLPRLMMSATFLPSSGHDVPLREDGSAEIRWN
jgi:hypothetical protein